MLHVQRIDHEWLVALYVLDSLLQGEACRVEANEDVAAEPFLNRLLQEHNVVEPIYFYLLVAVEELQNFTHWSRC